MLKNYVKVALRSIQRNRLTSFINVAGLALAMACCLLIALYVEDELSYDRHHRNADRTYRVTRYFYDQQGATSLKLSQVAPPIGMYLRHDFPEIEKVCRTLNLNAIVTVSEDPKAVKSFREENVFVAEPEFFDIFTVNVVEGNPGTALTEPFTIMLSERAAERYFGTTHVQGRSLQVLSSQFEFKVSGVFESFPAQGHFHPDFLISFSTMNDSTVYGREGLETNWGNNAFGTYILLRDHVAPEGIEAAFPDFLDNRFGAFAKANFGAPADFVASRGTSLQLQKLTDIHLHSHLDDELEPPGNIRNIYLMGVIGGFIILIASFNFINLSTAQATKRAKEVGVRKVAGAQKHQLVRQYLSESVLIALFAGVIAIAGASGALGWLNEFTGKSIQLMDQAQFAVYMVVAAVIVGALAGLYPALIVSGFRPAVILKNARATGGGKSVMRRILVVSQFAISIVLIIATAIISSQLEYLNSKELGYSRDRVVTLPYYSADLAHNYEAFYNELTNSTAVGEAGRSSRIPTGRLLDSSGAQIRIGDSLQNAGVRIAVIRVDHAFFDTYGISFVEGRNFSRQMLSDDSSAFVLNEAAIRALGITSEQAVGTEFVYGGNKGTIIGIVRDFHFESLHQQINPIVFAITPAFYNRMSIRLSEAGFADGLAHIEKVWREFLPDRLFEYDFLTDRYLNQYEAEVRQSQLFTGFAALAIFIACLGLFGLATFNTLQRIKEIGIRKVLGASIPNIMLLLSGEIVTLILVATVIAWPAAWYFADQWLESFAYRIDIGIIPFMGSALIAVLIALATVSAQTVRAAMSNPAKTLRYE